MLMAAASATRRSSKSRGSLITSWSPVENGMTAFVPGTIGACMALSARASGWAASIDRCTNLADSSGVSPKWIAYRPASVKSSLPNPEKFRSMSANGFPWPSLSTNSHARNGLSIRAYCSSPMNRL